MTAREAKHQYQLTEWAGKISERAKSGMTVREWCAANNINERVYHYWLRRVREYVAQFLPAPKSPVTLPVPVEAPTDNGHALLPSSTAACAPSGWAVCEAAPVETEPAQGITIEIGKSRITAMADTDPELLGKVCRVLVAL
jgi:hypothetical protein